MSVELQMTRINKWAATLNRCIHIYTSVWIIEEVEKECSSQQNHPNVQMHNICNTNVIDNSLPQHSVPNDVASKAAKKANRKPSPFDEKWRVGFLYI